VSTSRPRAVCISNLLVINKECLFHINIEYIAAKLAVIFSHTTQNKLQGGQDKGGRLKVAARGKKKPETET